MKKLLLTAFTALSVCGANAQFNYTFSKSTAAYAPLTAGISINDTVLWDEEYYKAPIGFSFNMDGVTIDSLSLLSGNAFATDTLNTVNSFIVTFTDFIDRGYFTDTVPHSPIRYQITGTTPNRIFKVEYFNAGFYDEYDLYSTNDDSVNFQVWLYETSNIVEFHFGGSQITYPDDYNYNNTGVVNMGYIKQLNLDFGTMTKFYFLTDSSVNPGIDSVSSIMAGPPDDGLDMWPSNGTVYRFTPPGLSVKRAIAALKQVNVYPTAAQGELFVENASDEAINYSIISMNGATGKITGTANIGKNTINISSLPAGSYTIQLSNGNVAGAVKFTKL